MNGAFVLDLLCGDLRNINQLEVNVAGVTSREGSPVRTPHSMTDGFDGTIHLVGIGDGLHTVVGVRPEMKITSFLIACVLLCACSRLPTPMVTAEPQRAGVGEQVQIHVTIPSESGISFRNSSVEFYVSTGGIFSDASVDVPDSGMVTTQLTAHTAGRYEVTAVFSFFEEPGSSGTTVVDFF